jgi:UDP:flavonoid glycosyltransferase YjiC (YdhE family)
MFQENTMVAQAETKAKIGKKRFLFCTGSGYGHFHPLVPLANTLISLGHEMAFAARPAVQAIVT